MADWILDLRNNITLNLNMISSIKIETLVDGVHNFKRINLNFFQDQTCIFNIYSSPWNLTYESFLFFLKNVRESDSDIITYDDFLFNLNSFLMQNN